LNVHDINDIGQTEMHTAEPLVPEHRYFEVDVAFEKLKGYKYLGIDQILAELIQTGSITLHPGTHSLINYIWDN
jgi:hypothetical protein